jgi:CheY-like chemotaxis protein
LPKQYQRAHRRAGDSVVGLKLGAHWKEIEVDIAAILEAVSKLAWPILVAVVLLKLYPSVRKIIESRGFTVRFGDMEVSVQEASDQFRAQIEDLQQKVSALRLQVQQQAELVAAAPVARVLERRPIKRILWVDDKPSNNAYEIAKLRDEGLQIVQAVSTNEAMGILLSGRLDPDAIISDMGRREEGQYRPVAGLTLIKAAREAGIQVPIFVYSSTQSASRYRDDVLANGGNGITASPVELFEMIHGYGDKGS